MVKIQLWTIIIPQYWKILFTLKWNIPGCCFFIFEDWFSKNQFKNEYFGMKPERQIKKLTTYYWSYREKTKSQKINFSEHYPECTVKDPSEFSFNCLKRKRYTGSMQFLIFLGHFWK